jgi:hypothetical protein
VADHDRFNEEQTSMEAREMLQCSDYQNMFFLNLPSRIRGYYRSLYVELPCAYAAGWSKGTPEDWATESLQLAKKAYCLPGTSTAMPSGAKLADDYCRMALPIIQRQLAKAGVRIAWTLNEIFR